MEFRVLGPLEVADQGRPLPLRGPAERHLLAVLLCLANEAVPVERLIDELWGEDPPSTARNMIQQYISRLRTQVGDRLATEPGGYRLRVSDDELDWAWFERATEEARDLPDKDAARLLSEALGLWRGPPLGGVGDGPTVVAERSRFAEARLAALEDRIDRDLGLGRHRDLIAELESLVGEHPLRERLHGQLMLALYRCDRQAEALRSFTMYRDYLAEETGLEPGPAVTELEQQILQRDPGLDFREPSIPPPSNLPHRISSFVGRKQEIATVQGMLAKHRLVTLTGTGGIGKTSLAIEAASGILDRFPDGISLVELAAIPKPELIGSAIAETLGITQRGSEDTVATLARELNTSESLLVLDNCEHVIDAVAKIVEKTLQATTHLRVLTTSRETLRIGGEAAYRVSPLDTPAEDATTEVLGNIESVRLLADRACLHTPGFEITDDNAAAVAGICRHLDGIPLAIELAAARLTTATPQQVAGQLGDRFAILTTGPRTAEPRHQTLQALIDWSHDLLTADERILLRRLSVFAGGFTAEAVHDVCGYEPLDPTTVPTLLDRLATTSLVKPPRPPSNRHDMLETIRHYAARQLGGIDETNPTMTRLAGYLLDAGPASGDGIPGEDAVAWSQWRKVEQDNYRAVLDWAVAEGDADVAASALIDLMNWLPVAEFERWLAAVLPMLGHEATARRFRLLGAAAASELEHGSLSRAEELIEQLHESADAAGELNATATARDLAARLARARGDLTECVRLNVEALDGYLRANNGRFMSAAFGLAMACAQSGRFEQATEVVESLAANNSRLSRPMDPVFIESLGSEIRALIALYSGDYKLVQELLEPAINTDAPGGLLSGDAQTLLGLGYAALARGGDEIDRARSYVEKASQELEGSGWTEGLRAVGTLQAYLALADGDLETARSSLACALHEATRAGAIVERFETVATAADVALAAGQPELATRLHASAAAARHYSSAILIAWQQERFSDACRTARDTLGDEFDRIWAEGAELPIDTALSMALAFAEQAHG